MQLLAALSLPIGYCSFFVTYPLEVSLKYDWFIWLRILFYSSTNEFIDQRTLSFLIFYFWIFNSLHMYLISFIDSSLKNIPKATK